jgi:hypothetical protein
MRQAIFAALGLAFLFLAATPSSADTGQSQRWFLALSTNERADLQGNLVLLAHYGGMVDGHFGAGTYSGLVKWQQSVGVRPTGVLSQQQMELLEQMAAKVISDLGMTLVEDIGGHLAIILPTKLLTVKRDRMNGTWYQDAAGEITVETFWRVSYEGTLMQHYARAKTPGPGRSVTYSTLRDNMYVVTGVDSGRYFYELAHADGLATAGFRFTYGERYRDIGGVASVFAASYSNPINVIEAAQSGKTDRSSSPPVTPTVTPQVSLPSTNAPATSKQKTGDDEEGVREFGNFITLADAPGVVALIGDIGPTTPLDFRRAIRSLDRPETLVLASDGGSVASALMVAYEVHELGLSTYVMPDTQCYSACSFIFLAGKKRLAEGQLGVHQVWGERTDASAAQTVVSDILEAFGEFGVRQEVTSAMLRTRPEDMYVFDTSELSMWGLNTP